MQRRLADAAAQLVVLDVLSAAVGEFTRDLAPGSVDLRLRGREVEFVVTHPNTEPAPATTPRGCARWASPEPRAPAAPTGVVRPSRPMKGRCQHARLPTPTAVGLAIDWQVGAIEIVASDRTYVRRGGLRRLRRPPAHRDRLELPPRVDRPERERVGRRGVELPTGSRYTAEIATGGVRTTVARSPEGRPSCPACGDAGQLPLQSQACRRASPFRGSTGRTPCRSASPTTS
ncbi:MAG: histidine kinase [Microbacteriaceae bacterium]|nr:histidine kinase [Microbacteriaceae bacterium]